MTIYGDRPEKCLLHLLAKHRLSLEELGLVCTITELTPEELCFDGLGSYLDRPDVKPVLDSLIAKGFAHLKAGSETEYFISPDPMTAEKNQKINEIFLEYQMRLMDIINNAV